jgi:hypothetical protein
MVTGNGIATGEQHRGFLAKVGDDDEAAVRTDINDPATGFIVTIASLRLVDGGVSLADCTPVASRDFPHTCERCGRRYYIGFRTVEHEGGGGCR